jgi:hypothetical protein
MEDVLAELDRLAKGPDPMDFEAELLQGMLTVSHQVHIITGYLLGSGHPESEFSAGEWKGEIDFARYPGIYELALGNTPSKYHPEGGHFFFDPGGKQFVNGVRRVLMEFVSSGEDSGETNEDTSG